MVQQNVEGKRLQIRPSRLRDYFQTTLPYSGKRKQVTKVTFLVKEQTVSVISTDVNGISWCLTYISLSRMSVKIWPGRRAHWVKYKNINNLDLDGMLLAPFCQSRAVTVKILFHIVRKSKAFDIICHTIKKTIIFSYRTFKKTFFSLAILIEQSRRLDPSLITLLLISS